MSKREQPDPGDGWRLATGDDYKDHRCEVWHNRWAQRFNVGKPFDSENNVYYRIPDDAPQPATSRDTEEQVCDDIKARQRLGVAKYGTTVADNPLSLRAWLQHAYEECLDQAVYLRRAITEIETKEETK
jgi:hypothetical protein